MESVFGSDIAFLVAWWTGAACIALVFFLMIEILFLRTLLIFRNRRITLLHEKWEPVLVETLERIPEILPSAPSRRNAFEFLLLWNHMQESLRMGEAGERLAAVAHRLLINQRALAMLDSRSLRTKLLAIQTLGYLKEGNAWDKLFLISRSCDPVLSLCAARALMRIDKEAALPSLLPELASREDWSLTIVGAMLKEAGADTISEPLARAVLLIPECQAPRMLRFLELAHSPAAAVAVRQLIARTTDLETITACLRILQDPEDLPIVRKFLKDGQWQIRLQAAVCLGRMGTIDDVPSLSHACGDLEWWVRYRAAQSLADLPFILPEKLKEIADQHQNEFGRDIISQVIAEREVTNHV